MLIIELCTADHWIMVPCLGILSVCIRIFKYSQVMLVLSLLSHVNDGRPLAECLDGGYVKDVVFYKQQEKLLFKNISKGQHESSRLSTESGPYINCNGF